MRARSSLALWLAGPAAVACAAAPAPPKRPAPDAGIPRSAVPPRGPVAVYDKACLRCHGPEGVNYGPTFGKALTDRALRQAVLDMKDGKGDIALTDDEIDAQTAYHRAIIRREPFVVVTLDLPRRLAGECTEDAVVTVTVDGKSVPVQRSGYRWDAAVPAGERREIAARVGKATTRLDPAKARWSHADPLPDPAPPAPKKD